MISRGLIALFESYFSAVFLATIAIISLLIIFEAELKLESFSFIGKLFRRKKTEYDDVEALAEKYADQTKEDNADFPSIGDEQFTKSGKNIIG